MSLSPQPPSSTVEQSVTRIYPFDPSDDDRASLDGARVQALIRIPVGSEFERGLRVVHINAQSALGRAGLKDGDLIVEFDGLTFPASMRDPVKVLWKRLGELHYDQRIKVTYLRDGAALPRSVQVALGRRPPPFDRIRTELSWFDAPVSSARHRKLIDRVRELEQGRVAYDDVLARNRSRFAMRDSLRLRETTQVHLDLSAHESMARMITDTLAIEPEHALEIAAPGEASKTIPGAALAASMRLPSGGVQARARQIASALESLPFEALVTILVAALERAAEGIASARGDWSGEEQRAFMDYLHGLQSRLSATSNIYGDPKVERERGNRRLVRLLERIDRQRVRDTVLELQFVLRTMLPHLERSARAKMSQAPRDLLLKQMTRYGAVEIWGAGDQRHTTRTLFRLDLQGNDQYLDVAGRADPAHPVSVSVDLKGDDLYSATSLGVQGVGLGGIGILIDRSGDDRYLARYWSQGVGVGGFGLLIDEGGSDVYRSLSLSQGLGFAGAGILTDRNGNDQYSSLRYAQGLGLAGGVGALLDASGNDQYTCTGRDRSSYGENGLFDGWGQGVGFGFRLISSGGIGILHDGSGDDVYEAGNFSQGGGYHFGWGIVRDDEGNDLYIGGRYAQGFAAHQAEGTFIEGGGDDRYRSLSDVANGLAWDQASVVFHDHAGNDVYETAGFSLGAAAHNGMVLFIDGAGDDVYRTVPGRARPNDFRGGHSLSIAADFGGGVDRYGAGDHAAWNNRVWWKDDMSYVLDLPTYFGANQPLYPYIPKVQAE